MGMPLFHVSDHGDIEAFVPRPAPSAQGPARALVWALDTGHLAHYLVPRDCPRVCFRAGPDTSALDRARFLGQPATPVVAIEAAWLERALRTPLWLYTLPPQPFALEDENAGYFVSATTVSPLARRRLEQPLLELVAAGVELRVVPQLRPLAAAVAASSLAFSCIRMRNAHR